MHQPDPKSRTLISVLSLEVPKDDFIPEVKCSFALTVDLGGVVVPPQLHSGFFGGCLQGFETMGQPGLMLLCIALHEPQSHSNRCSVDADFS
jgi:hypothetical protein